MLRAHLLKELQTFFWTTPFQMIWVFILFSTVLLSSMGCGNNRSQLCWRSHPLFIWTILRFLCIMVQKCPSRRCIGTKWTCEFSAVELFLPFLPLTHVVLLWRPRSSSGRLLYIILVVFRLFYRTFGVEAPHCYPCGRRCKDYNFFFVLQPSCVVFSSRCD